MSSASAGPATVRMVHNKCFSIAVSQFYGENVMVIVLLLAPNLVIRTQNKLHMCMDEYVLLPVVFKVL